MFGSQGVITNYVIKHFIFYMSNFFVKSVRSHLTDVDVNKHTYQQSKEITDKFTQNLFLLGLLEQINCIASNILQVPSAMTL